MFNFCNATIIIKNPVGTYSLVGRVPVTLSYTMADGSPLTEDAANAICQCGPGILGKKVKVVTYATENAAQTAIDAFAVSA